MRDGSLGFYSDRVIEVLQHTFAPMYERVWRDLWNNSVFATMRRPYIYYSWEDGVYEVYIPIALDGEGFMHYWRVMVRVFEEIDRETIAKNQAGLETPWIKPVGVIDSESIFYISNGISSRLKDEIRKHGRKALIKGFRHKRKAGYFTFIIVNSTPEIAVKRLKDQILNFLKTRIKNLLKKLKLQPWIIERCIDRMEKGTLLNINILLESFSMTVRNIAVNMANTFMWIKGKLKELKKEIGRQNILKTKIIPIIKQLKEYKSAFMNRNVMRNPDIPDPPIIGLLVEAYG